LGLNANELVIGWVGRLAAEKGPDLLLDAIERHPGIRARLVIIGEGPMRTELEARARARGLTVSFRGAIPDASTILTAFDVLVMSSRTEGMPMVLLEAMSAGVPVVGFVVGGMGEVLTERTGWPVRPADVTGLGRALELALNDPSEVTRRGRAGSEIVARFHGVDAWVDAMEAVYASALANRDRRLSQLGRVRGEVLPVQ
jgi:glycosyltransferase involved in cell wall biosynthesis